MYAGASAHTKQDALRGVVSKQELEIGVVDLASIQTDFQQRLVYDSW